MDESTTFAQQSEDDNVLVSTVAGDPNGSATSATHYLQNKDKVKAVQIDGGAGCIEPTPTTIGDGTYAPLSRPLFIYPNTAKAKESPALYEFVNFYLAHAADLATEPTIGYVAVPDDIAAQQLANWNSAVPQ